MNRFISAMPSSICWPLGENVQRKVDGMRSPLKRSADPSRANRRRRLTQAPRLVETVTSGEAVRCAPQARVVAARDLVEQRAETILRGHFRLDGHRQFVGHRDARRRADAFAGLRERHGAQESAQLFGSCVQALERDPIRGRGECSWRRGSHHLAGVIRPA